MTPSTPCCRKVATMTSEMWVRPRSSTAFAFSSWASRRSVRGSWKTSPAFVKANAGASFFSLSFFFLPRSSIACETTISGRARTMALSGAEGSGLPSSAAGFASSACSSRAFRRRLGGVSGSSAAGAASVSAADPSASTQAGSSKPRRTCSSASAPATARASARSSSPSASISAPSASSSASARRTRSRASSARSSATATRCSSTAAATRSEVKPAIAPAARAKAAAIDCGFTSAATMSATIATAETRIAVPQVEKSRSAKPEQAAPTTPPAGKDARTRSPRARWPSVATASVRTM